MITLSKKTAVSSLIYKWKPFYSLQQPHPSLYLYLQFKDHSINNNYNLAQSYSNYESSQSEKRQVGSVIQSSLDQLDSTDLLLTIFIQSFRLCYLSV